MARVPGMLNLPFFNPSRYWNPSVNSKPGCSRLTLQTQLLRPAKSRLLR